MSARAAILGSAARIARRFDRPLEFAVHDTVLRALADAGFDSLDDIDTVVTAASDTLDGIMVATRSEIAGGAGRGYLHMPSSAGHALAAAATMIEAGTARHVLLVGWGEGSKLTQQDSRVIQADPFFARPAGADPASVAALQAQFLIAAGRIDAATADRYVHDMAGRAWPGQELPSGAGPAWLRTGWCDGVAALVLVPAVEFSGAVRIRDFATSFRPYTADRCIGGLPDLDPADWVADAVPAFATPPDVIEVSAPTPIGEARAGTALTAAPGWAGRLNPSGGGAAAYFGIATGLQRLCAAAAALRPGHQAGVIDLAGPIGQAVTVMALDRGAAA